MQIFHFYSFVLWTVNGYSGKMYREIVKLAKPLYVENLKVYTYVKTHREYC
jgi:hypothetical protein